MCLFKDTKFIRPIGRNFDINTGKAVVSWKLVLLLKGLHESYMAGDFSLYTDP